MSGYLTTNENGEFTGTVTGLTAGQKVITATFEGDNEYNRSTTNKQITILDPEIVLSLTSPTPIIEVGGTSVITATLTKNGLPYVNQEINYEIKHGSTLIDADSDFTNNAGQITIPYTGTGVGDVDIIVTFSALVQETFTVQDCIIYDPLTSNSGKWTIPSGVSSTYSSNGWNVSATSYSQVKLTDKITSDCSVEFTLVDYNITSAGGSCIIYAYTNGETTPNKIIIDSRSNAHSTSAVFGTALDHRFANGTKFRIDYTSSTLKVYENDVLIGTDSNSVGLPTRFEFHIGSGGRTVTYKDLKVKAL